MTDLQIANMLADYHKECELAETLREKADVQLKHARLIREALCQPLVSGSLPSLDDVTKVAVRISEEAIKPPLDAKEQAMFIAGFQECIKWLNVFFGNDR